MPIASMADLKKGGGDGDDGIPSSAMEGPVDGEKLSKWFMGLYHEKQIGGLCAVHCLNNLIQGQVFDEVQLAEIAHEMDRRERETLGGAGLEMESGNVRADGFFSVQVIQAALQSKGLQCLNLGSSEATAAQENPVKEVAFICNRSEHWFALRRVGPYWFDVNSTLKMPRFISDTYLAMTLSQSKQDGYSVFVVRGKYPACDLERPTDRKRLDAVAQACKEGVSGQVKPSSGAATAASAFSGAGYSLAGPPASASAPSGMDKPGLAEALAAAGVDANADPELAAAIAASLGDGASPAPAASSAGDSAEEMRRKRLARFGG